MLPEPNRKTNNIPLTHAQHHGVQDDPAQHTDTDTTYYGKHGETQLQLLEEM